jgi:membrane-bound lytic murein transglycosylase D
VTPVGVRGGTGERVVSRSPARLALAGVLVLAVTFAGCQRASMERPGPPVPTADRPGGEIGTAPTPTLPGRVDGGAARALPPLAVDLGGIDPILHTRIAADDHLRERTAFWVNFWSTRARGQFEQYLVRMARSDAFVDAEIAARGLPPSLRYLPIVESGYHFSVGSRAGAVGLWQFMGPTARSKGLVVDGIVDDRRDPIASTHAALEYLTDLYVQFGSWYLALAAYNAGPGRVAGVLARLAPDDTMDPDERYLRALSGLPAETREFVPRFFAAAALASDPEAHGFAPFDRSNPFVFEEVRIPDAASLDVLARAAEVEEAMIRSLNPQFMRGFTPPGQQRLVRLPLGTAERFERNFALIPPEERISFLEHSVASGETLGHIARRYGVTVAELQGANGNVDPRRLQIGRRLIVPIAGRTPAPATRVAAAPASANADSDLSGDAAAGSGAERTSDTSSSAPAVNGARSHVVGNGDSLWTIGRRYGVSVEELRRWNGLGERAVLQPGQELAVGSEAAFYRVRSGDTWGGIAQRLGVSMAELARVNGRTTRDVIRIGEQLRIP